MSQPTKARLRAAAVLAVVATFMVALSLPSAGGAAPPGCDNRNNNTYAKLLDCVTVEGVRAHQAAFQGIAEANEDEFYPGSRAAGTDGYAESVEYVAGLLEDAGYEVTLDPFQFEFEFPVILDQLEPVEASFEASPATGTGFGNVTDDVVAVDINLDPPRANDSGCSTDLESGDPENDFVGFPAGAIALVQRGFCTFAEKAQNAQTAGASAVVIFNQGNTPDREGVVFATLAPFVANIPVVGTTFAAGESLAEDGSIAHVRVDPTETRTDFNVIAELPGDNPDNIVMAGAHLDSVPAGPGINDNGSGSAALLETALMMAKLKPENTLRFAWWGAEELGLIGSSEYVEDLERTGELDRIALYLNYDMVGSPNYIFMVYDANESTYPAPTGVPIPEGSEAIENLYERYYTLVGEPYDDSEFSGRSDYQAFIEAGIPAGGLFTGAEVLKKPEQAAIWGGIAGQQFDQNYHEVGDTFGNVNLHALEVNSDLIAFAQMTFAYSTETVNQVPGERVPGPPLNLPEPAGPEGTNPEE
jgi:hypothetical protein